MITSKVWPNGTQKSVTILKVFPLPPNVIVAFLDEIANEGFICMYHGKSFDANEGDRGTITYQQIKPDEGRWVWKGELDQ